MSTPAERRDFERKVVKQVVLGKTERAEDWVWPPALLFSMVWGMVTAASLRSWSEGQNLGPHPRPLESESAFEVPHQGATCTLTTKGTIYRSGF